MKKPSLIVLGLAVVLFVGVLIGRSNIDNSAKAQTAPTQATEDQLAEGRRVRSQIQNDPVAPTVNPKGADVTLVMFTDYQCPFCRKVHPVLEQLQRDDPKVKIVYRDWPIFGAGSEEAARVAIASQYQGKHAAFNDAMMTTPGKVTSQSIRAAADKAGVDWARLQSDLKTHASDIDGALGRTSQYAAMMGLSGTPAMLVGPYLVPGAMDIAGLREAVAQARANPDGKPAA